MGFDDFTEPAGQLEALAKQGCAKAEVAPALAHLRGLAARLVIPGQEPMATAKDGNGATAKDGNGPPIGNSALNRMPTSPESFAAQKPVVSRLATNPKLHGVIFAFIEKLNDQLLKMDQAYTNGNLDELAMLALWLKGAGGTVGFDDFTKPAAELGKFAKSGQAEQAGRFLAQVQGLAKAIVAPTLSPDHLAANESKADGQNTVGNCRL